MQCLTICNGLVCYAIKTYVVTMTGKSIQMLKSVTVTVVQFIVISKLVSHFSTEPHPKHPETIPKTKLNKKD